MNALLLQTVLSLVIPLAASTAGQSTLEDVPAEQPQAEATLGSEEYALYSATGLVTVGGAGAIIIAHNSKKKKNVPSSELRAEETDKDAT